MFADVQRCFRRFNQLPLPANLEERDAVRSKVGDISAPTRKVRGCRDHHPTRVPENRQSKKSPEAGKLRAAYPLMCGIIALGSVLSKQLIERSSYSSGRNAVTSNFRATKSNAEPPEKIRCFLAGQV